MSDRPSDGTSADAVTHRTEATPAERVADPVAPEPVAARRKRGFPSALTILIWVIVGVWLVALVIPSGQYRLDESGHPVPGSFQEIDSPLTFGESVRELLLSPINGLYGIQDPETGQVGPFNAGVLFGSAQVFLFILAIGGFMDRGLQDRGARHRDRSPRPPLQDSRSFVDRRAERPLRGARLGHLVE